MQTATLYVIGNGFDLRHNMPSSLWHFKEFLLAMDSDIYRDVEECLLVDNDWSDLETALADLDVDMLINNLGHFMSSYGDEDWGDAGHHDFQYEVDQVIRGLSKGMRSRFGQWIRQLPIPSCEGLSNRLTKLDSQALFLTFSYTSTLRRVYGVGTDRVLHIHGSAEARDDELILRHAWEPESRASLNYRANIADMDTRLMVANSIIDDYFCAASKPSQKLIAKHRHFFEGLSGVK